MRLSSVRLITGVSCVIFAAAAWHVSSLSSTFTAEAQTSKPAQPHSFPMSLGSRLHPHRQGPPHPRAQPIAAPGTEIYTAKRGEAIPTIARHYLGKTSYLTSSELATPSAP